MSFTKSIRQFCFFAALCVIPLAFGLNRAEPFPPFHPTNGNAQRSPPPIPKAGPLARPKSDHQLGVPDGAVAAAVPADNPQSPEKVALGKKLFFDGHLSLDGTVACNTCHDPARAFTDGRASSRRAIHFYS